MDIFLTTSDFIQFAVVFSLGGMAIGFLLSLFRKF